MGQARHYFGRSDETRASLSLASCWKSARSRPISTLWGSYSSMMDEKHFHEIGFVDANSVAEVLSKKFG
jgi:hypothetical protein